jgi:hypothetical protein
MKILLFAHEFPYPPNHGGKADIWNKIKAFKSVGYSVFLVTWYEIVRKDFPSDKEIDTVRDVVDDLLMFQIRRDFTRLINLYKMPSLVSARILRSKEFEECKLKVGLYNPDIVFVDGIYAGECGLSFSKMFDIPLGVRLHNVEHTYMRGQLKLATNWKQKLAIGLALLHLEKFEETLIATSTAFFDISLADLNSWKQKGFRNGYWLPPMVSSSQPIQASLASYTYDLCFLGNLHTPNNVNGLNWFIKDVLPLLKKKGKSAITILIMGSKPSKLILDICKNEKSVVLIPDPTIPEIYLEKSHILINPVNFSSGVNIKAVDMLFTDKPVVTTSHGIKGLPSEIRKAFCVADEAEEFADAIINITAAQLAKNIESRLILRKRFYYNNVEVVRTALKDKVSS